MKKTWVYKINRSDGLSYIGITVNPKHRFKGHKKSNRFEMGIESIEILKECDTYEQAEQLEEYYIQKYDTYKNGLNLTPRGKGLNENCKFNTLGYIFSEKSRRKMSKSSMGNKGFSGGRHTEETKKNWSDKRKGVCWVTNLKLSEEQVEYIKNNYGKIEVTEEFLKNKVKKTQQKMIGEVSYDKLISKNGKPINYLTFYCDYMANKMGVTSAYIRRIIDGKSRNGTIHHTER